MFKVPGLTTPEEMYEFLQKAQEAYYSGEPIMSDTSFDALEERLRAVAPDHEYFKSVGATTTGKKKLKHSVPMLSAGKAKTPAEAWAWAEKIGYSGRFLIQAKVDGLSCAVKYKDGKLQYVATRGDGEIGQNITHIAEKVFGILPTIQYPMGEVEVRGELYIPKRSKMPNPDNKPLRNMAVGFINRKDNLDDLQWLRFVSYQVIGGDFKTETEKLEWLNGQGFHAMPWDYDFTKLSELEWAYDKYLKDWRNSWEWETDGLMLVVDDCSQHARIDSKWEVSHHHHYNLALKPQAETAETELVTIEWNVSRLGRLYPTAIFKPVTLGGAVVKRASLTSYENVIRMKLEQGDRLLVSRANDVIPYVEANLSKGVSQR